MLAWVVAAAVVVPENSIRAGSRYEAESAHHPARCSHSFNCLEGLSPICSGRGACPSRKSFPRVAMMQSGQDWCDDDGPRSLDGSSLRRILRQSEVCACLIVIERIQSQNSPQMPFVEDQDMVQAVAPECPRSGAQHRGLT